MKVGIYNQFLQTMGGGERHMGMAAEVLAGAGHEVEIITHVPVAVETLAARFDLHLPGVRVITTPLLPFDQLGDLSAAYDLWINASFMSVVPSRAPRSLLLVLFPFPLDETPFGRFKRRVAGHIHRELYVPRYGEGFFGPQELGGSRYRWTAGKGQVSISLPSLLRAPAAPGTGGRGGGGALPLRLVLGSFRPAGWGPVPVTVRAGGEVVLRTDVETTPGIRDAGRGRPRPPDRAAQPAWAPPPTTASRLRPPHLLRYCPAPGARCPWASSRLRFVPSRWGARPGSRTTSGRWGWPWPG